MLNEFFNKLKTPNTAIQIGDTNNVDRVVGYNDQFNFEQYVEDNKNKNLFFIAGVKESVSTRAKNVDIVAKNYIAFDFDIRDEKEKEAHRDCDDEQLLKIADEIKKSLDANENFKTYSYIIFSGNGIHVYYFGKTIKITDTKFFRAGMKKYVDDINKISPIPADDACVNSGRIFRIPESVNQKNNKQSYFLEIKKNIYSPLVERVLELGKQILINEAKKTLERQANFDNKNTSNDVYDTINNLSIQKIVCEIMGWEFDNKENFNEPEQEKKKACFVPLGCNFIVHNGTDHFSNKQKGYNVFQFIRMIKNFDNRQTFEWFEEKYLHIKSLAEKNRKQFAQNGTATIKPTSVISLENKNTANKKDTLMDLSCIPQDTFLIKLVELYDGVTDAPDEFLITSGLLTLSTIMKSNVWLAYGNQMLRPHLWAVIIAPSSRFRKTTVINSAKSLITKFNPSLIFSNEITPETFIEHLSDFPYGLLTSSEMGGLLKQMERTYMSGFKELLTDLYDSPENYTRKRKDKQGNPITFEIKKPTLNILAGTTLSWFLKNAQEGDIASGFLPRFIFAHIKYKTKKAIIFPKETDRGIKKIVAKHLSIIAQHWNGKKDLSEKARKIYFEWATYLETEMEREANPIIDAFYTRLNVNTLKIAMAIEASIMARECYLKNKKTTNNHNSISEEAMSTAIGLSDYYRQSCQQLVNEEFIFSKYGQDAKKVKQKLIKSGGKLSKRDLLRKLGIRVDCLDKILKTLEEAGDITVTEIRQSSGQPTQEVRLTK